jgi:plasmid stability protein
LAVTRNLTLAIDDDLLDKVRVLAAMKRTSVNEMVRGFLTRLVEQESEHDEATEGLLKLARESKGRMGEWRFSREETYSGEPRFDREY